MSPGHWWWHCLRAQTLSGVRRLSQSTHVLHSHPAANLSRDQAFLSNKARAISNLPPQNPPPVIIIFSKSTAGFCIRLKEPTSEPSFIAFRLLFVHRPCFGFRFSCDDRLHISQYTLSTGGNFVWCAVWCTQWNALIMRTKTGCTAQGIFFFLVYDFDTRPPYDLGDKNHSLAVHYNSRKSACKTQTVRTYLTTIAHHGWGWWVSGKKNNHIMKMLVKPQKKAEGWRHASQQNGLVSHLFAGIGNWLRGL